MQVCFLHLAGFMRQLIEKYDTQLDWGWLTETRDWTIRQALAVQQIAAPTFGEDLRAKYVQDQFGQLGLTAIASDEVHNVLGLLPGKNRDLPGIMICAHTDTVFAQDTDLTIHSEGNLIYGPGLGDNSMGVAGLLALAYFFQLHNLTPECDLWFVATSCEEGLGNLRGMKAAFAQLQAQIGIVINLEGLAFGHVYNAGISVRRLRIMVKTEGGHSWLHFGRPSALHGLMELGARISSMSVPTNPRTTYNIGVVSGGQSINSIASQAEMWLDLRSEDRKSLESLEHKVREHIASLQNPDMQFAVEVVGDRPAGSLSPDHPLIVGAMAALERVGVRGALETGSTDGNISLAAGCPTVTIGITKGGNAHRLDEFIEIEPVEFGLRQLTLLTLAAAAYQLG